MSIELLAPAGSWEAMTAAIAAGADAVYLGGPAFGARAYAKNLDTGQILDAIDYVHLHHRKLYLTVNTLFKEEELENQLYEYLLPFYEQGLDAVIVQDLGVFSAIRRLFPDLAIHASTQMTIAGPAAARFIEQQGAVRVVPARELNLQEIRKIRDTTNLEIECFVHGAICYCYSGMCLFSGMLGGRSGNRGRCAQPCRLPYDVFRESGRMGETDDRYPLSLKDMCTVELIPQLAGAGITSFKIEGRMKKPEYTAGVVSIYRKYLDLYEKGKGKYRVLPEDLKKLYDLYNRDGFNQSYYRQRNGRDMIALKNEKLKMGKDRNDELLYDIEKNFLDVYVQEPVSGFISLFPGEEASLTVNAGAYSATVTGDIVQTASKRPLTEEKVREQLNKTGNSSYRFEELDIYMDSHVFYSLKGLNELRRSALSELEAQILLPTRRSVRGIKMNSDGNFRILSGKKTENIQKPETDQDFVRNRAVLPELHVLCEERYQFRIARDFENVQAVYASLSCFSAENFTDQVRTALADFLKTGRKLYLVLPHMVRMGDLDPYREAFTLLAQEGLAGFLVRNLESYAWLREQGLGEYCALDYSVYTFNSGAQAFWNDRKILFDTVPVELNARELQGRDNTNSELIVYGYLPMMVSAQCVRKTLAGCNKKQELLALRDRYGKDFHVRCYCNSCYNVIYNTIPTSLWKEMDEVKHLSPRSVRVSFSIESKEETSRILDAWTLLFAGENPRELEGEFTKGHFRRGVE